MQEGEEKQMVGVYEDKEEYGVKCTRTGGKEVDMERKGSRKVTYKL